MIISNLRFGFACNSSSTHSVVVLPKGTSAKNSGLSDNSFGWEFFVAASKEAKKAYLKSILKANLTGDVAERLPELMFGDTGRREGIDHQSLPLIPFKKGGINLAFFDEMTHYILRSDVVILGGNDNEENSVGGEWGRLNAAGTRAPWHRRELLEKRPETWLSRKEGDWWVLFNREDGTKVTLSFNDNPTPRTRAEVPELVDLKITDFCPYACTYCYQGSTHKGGHAEDITSWLYHLDEWGVFEVAIGGGEPTLHPQFNSLFDRLADLRVNFTTRNLDWIDAHQDLALKAGSIAISIDSYHGRHGYVSVMDRVRRWGKNLQDKIQLQYVMESASDWDFETILKVCKDEHVRLTLLGYKTTGRGEGAKKTLPLSTALQKGKGWVKKVKESYYVAIDTALAASVEPGVFPEHLLRRTEGTHSCYIDAVTKTLHKSSYDGSEGTRVEPYAHALGDAYRSL